MRRSFHHQDRARSQLDKSIGCRAEHPIIKWRVAHKARLREIEPFALDYLDDGQHGMAVRDMADNLDPMAQLRRMAPSLAR
jgi:hypothetical protein